MTKPVSHNLSQEEPTALSEARQAAPQVGRSAPRRCRNGARARDRAIPHGAGPIRRRDRALETRPAARRRRAHDPPCDHGLQRRGAAHGAAFGTICLDGNVSSRSRDHHSRRIELPMGYSKACRCRSALSSAQNAHARGRRSRHRQADRSCWSERRIPIPSRPGCS